MGRILPKEVRKIQFIDKVLFLRCSPNGLLLMKVALQSFVLGYAVTLWRTPVMSRRNQLEFVMEFFHFSFPAK
jgi:hypothetical protein